MSEQLKLLIADLYQMVHYAQHERCIACGWPLAKTAIQGCVQGNCSFRPDEHSIEYLGWHRRQTLAFSLHGNQGVVAAVNALPQLLRATPTSRKEEEK